ncbi:hypothetical protein [Sansalvadorimonas verongulae]|uniref:hypothetical protein n=1 Tax=Sansalvadorimonas verongulae TaxID=2172824 RepID=UPI0012BB7F2F|nr:hypothetical protein [Sansalvadorimonas verongulae]MTI11728.1 hypothetical protein [Sansalvadorimonas verongulae]
MRVKQVDRIEGDTTEAGGVPLPPAPGVAAAPAVRVKHIDRIKDEAAGAGGVPPSSTYCPLLILAQYVYCWCRAIVVQITWDC